MLENSLLVKILKEKIKYTAERHGVIASNIANISTPMTLTRDLPSFDKLLKQNCNFTIPLRKTSASHIVKHHNSYSYPVIYSTEGTEPKLNGNNISLSNESIKLNRNNLEYQKAMSTYSKILSLFHIAIGSR